MTTRTDEEHLAELAAETHREHREAERMTTTNADAGIEVWLTERRKGIGASEVAILFGVSPYGSMLSLWAEKTGRGTAERTPATAMAMRIGNELEGFVIRLAEEETGGRIDRNSESMEMPGHPLVRATTDGFLTIPISYGWERGCMDAKVVGPHNAGEWLDGIIPLHYQIQLQTQMAVTGCSWALIAGLLLGSSRPLVCMRLEADPELAAIIVDRVEWFWRTYVEPDVAPPADDRAVTTAALAAMHPNDNGMLIELGRPLEHAKNEWIAAKLELAATKKRIALRENQLRLGMADATFGSFPDGTGVSLKTQTHSSGSTFRVLRAMKPSAVDYARTECDARLDELIGRR